MASGDSLLQLNSTDAQQRLTTDATHGVVNDQATLDFSSSATDTARFRATMPQHYAGTTGVTCILHMSTVATTGDVDWDMEWENQDGQVVTSDSFAAANSTNNTSVPGTASTEFTVTITFTDGADMDSVAAGDMFRIRVTRDGVSDTAAADVRLHMIEIQET